MNVAEEQRKQSAADKRQAIAAARAEMMRMQFAAVVAEMNATFGPFDVSTERGMDMLNCTVARATGKDLAKHRDQRIAV